MSQLSDTLRDEVRRVIEELDPDGGGFRTDEAVDLLYFRIMQGLGFEPGLGVP